MSRAIVGIPAGALTGMGRLDQAVVFYTQENGRMRHWEPHEVLAFYEGLAWCPGCGEKKEICTCNDLRPGE
jgi:hypothetical protein